VLKEDRMSNHRHLFVLRHAKSSWDNPGLDDHERPLAPRGHHAVKLLGKHLRTAGVAPEQVLCSSARRTRETLAGVDPTGERVVERGLYSASAHDVLVRLRQVSASTESVMVVGHNPAMQMLVLRLIGANGNGGPSASPDAETDVGEVQRKFPTGALATLEFDCGWHELGPGCARLTAFVVPRHLS
jgi:phosphohistidine phosphatase